MKNAYLLLFFGLLTNFVFAQDPCSNGRYADAVFSQFNLTSNLTYGQNSNWANSTTVLKLDFYEPANDTLAARPLIIWVHGGSFIGGSKTDPDVKALSERFALKGYACASIDYRLGFFPIDSANAIKAVVRAVQDLKAAIRFFYKDAQTSNLYQIDTNHIFIGGSSAGAITALHVAYLDDACELSDYMNASTLANMGGLEGNSGNPGYSTTVHAVINGCGALARYNWLEAGDVPLCSVHGTSDGTVKYNRGIVNPGTPLMYLDGSRMIHERACAIGVTNQFYTFNNAPHVPYLSNAAYMDSTERFVRDFLVGVMGCNQSALLPANEMQEQAVLYPTTYCDGTPSNEACGTNNLTNWEEIEVKVYPNPTQGDIRVQSSETLSNINIYSFDGKIFLQLKTNPSLDQEISLDTLPNGIYILEVETENQQISRTKIQILR
ncbi:MAG: T9SS type A sorting domain-containing protein [Flavobacteriia bacterium]|jgi:para-nitrobenzyl esterase